MGEHDERGGAQPARDEIWQSWRRTCARERRPSPRRGALRPTSSRLPRSICRWRRAAAGSAAAWVGSYASDLNPVAVLINKAMIEIPPRFAGRPPVESRCRSGGQAARGSDWNGARGLPRTFAITVSGCATRLRDALDICIRRSRSQTRWRDRPDLQPVCRARPDCDCLALGSRPSRVPTRPSQTVDVPLASTFMLLNQGWQGGLRRPQSLGRSDYRFLVQVGKPTDRRTARAAQSRAARTSNASCRTPISGEYIHAERQGRAHRALGSWRSSPKEIAGGSISTDGGALRHRARGRAGVEPEHEIFSSQVLGVRIGYGLTQGFDLLFADVS